MSQPSEQEPAILYRAMVGKTLLLTGGAGGIGQAIVAAFQAQGVKVFFLDLDEKAGKEVQDHYPPDTQQPEFLACDLQDITALRAVIAEIAEMNTQIDFVVNCAGDDSRHEWLDLEPGDWDRCQDLNLRHVLFTSQAAFPHMPPGGAIVNLGSKNAVNKKAGLIGYASAKAAIMGLTGSLARECGTSGVRVNCVMPGMVKTPRNYAKWITPEIEANILDRQCLKAVATPENVADLVLFLCSDQSALITGQSIQLDGGS